MITYNVVYEGDDASGWSGYVPDLPGVGVAGATLDEVRRLAPGAIELHLRGLQEDGVPFPTPTALIVEAVAVPAA
jgi:predicted RNase H-like HicB family nuclease